MLTERALESKVIDAIKAAFPSGVRAVFVGFWQPATAGRVKGWEDDPSAVALVGVSCGIGSQQAFSNPQITFPVSVSLSVRLDADPQGSALSSAAEAVNSVLRGWMATTYQQDFTALDVDGLSVDGVSVSGDSVITDVAARVSRVSWSVTLTGSINT